MPKLNVNGLLQHVLDEGEGPPILFVHGFPLTHAMWAPQIEALKTGHRIIAPDLAGFGESGCTAGTVSMRQFADDLSAMLNELRIDEPIVFCGLSMGGYIAWQFMEANPERVRGLVLCDTKATADSEDAVQGRYKLAESVLKHGAGVVAQAMPEKLFAAKTLEHQPEIVNNCKNMMLAADPEGIAAALRGMAERPDMSALLPNIAVPTLVVVGEDDQITTVEEMRAMSRHIPRSTFLEVTDAGHMAPLEQPHTVNAALVDFLANL